RPHLLIACVAQRGDEAGGAGGEPAAAFALVARQLAVWHSLKIDELVRSGPHDLGCPPLRAAEMGSQLAQRPVRAGRDRQLRIGAVDDDRELRGAGLNLGVVGLSW